MAEEYNDSGLQDFGLFNFHGDVEDELVKEAIEFILLENFKSKHKELTMVINSYGGSTSNGFSLIDVMCGSRIPIKTVGLGMLASMGLHLFITGKKGERVLTPNTLILSHQWSCGTGGKAHELVAAFKQFDLLTEMQIRHYKRHTGLTEKKIKRYLVPASDVYLSANEALDLGLCDQVRDFY